MSIEIPARLLGEPRVWRHKPFIQWSENGEKLLIYGHNQEYCPLGENPVSGDLEEDECWLVVDSDTGDILWGPKMVEERLLEIIGYPLEISFSPCAGFSPDGDWLAICFQSGAIGDFVFVALDNSHHIVDFGWGPYSDFKWINSLDE